MCVISFKDFFSLDSKQFLFFSEIDLLILQIDCPNLIQPIYLRNRSVYCPLCTYTVLNTRDTLPVSPIGIHNYT